jgi:hypothetical protein
MKAKKRLLAAITAISLVLVPVALQATVYCAEISNADGSECTGHCDFYNAEGHYVGYVDYVC